MPRARKSDPNLTEADKAAIRNNRTAKRNGKLSSHAQGIDEERAARLARGQAAIDAAMAGCEKSIAAQVEQREMAEEILLGRAAKITDEQLVELVFENFPVSSAQAIERLARFDANEMRRQLQYR